jgi:hypothetical protein
MLHIIGGSNLGFLAVNIVSLSDSMSSSMALAIRRIPRMQGHGEAAAGLFDWMAEHHKTVCGGEVDLGDVVGCGKSGSAGRGEEAWRRGRDLPEVVGKMGQVNWRKIAPLADRAGPQSFEA